MLSNDLLSYAMERLHAARSVGSRPCKVCGGPSHLFDMVDYNKSCDPALYPSGLEAIPVLYRMCGDCGFTFTDFFEDFSHEQWSQYVYNDEYIDVDPEYLVIRPARNARDIEAFLGGQKESAVGLDYGGGNGKTVALLREGGWAFDSYDPFGTTSISPDRLGRYNFCSAMEVFEHVPDPLDSMRDIVSRSSPGKLAILIGTQVLDHAVTNETRLSWWYAAPRNGHVSLYSTRSLEILGAAFGLAYQCFRTYPHLFTRGYSKREAQMLLLRYKIRRKMRSAA